MKVVKIQLISQFVGSNSRSFETDTSVTPTIDFHGVKYILPLIFLAGPSYFPVVLKVTVDAFKCALTKFA
jgi:hypothetical protein